MLYVYYTCHTISFTLNLGLYTKKAATIGSQRLSYRGKFDAHTIQAEKMCVCKDIYITLSPEVTSEIIIKSVNNLIFMINLQ